MPSFSDSAVIFVIALLLFGPKKLPELARYLGKLMGEFRRASAEFRLQMEDEFRVIEQAEQQKKIAAIEAAAPIAPPSIPEPEHPHLPAPLAEASAIVPDEEIDSRLAEFLPEEQRQPIKPLPIAASGDLTLMPPSTGLPTARTSGSTSLAAVFEAIPHTSDNLSVTPDAQTEATHHG